MKMKILAILLLFIFSLPALALANGGDQRIVEGKYLINLSRAPFTPHVGDKVALLASFVDIEKNKLVSEDLLVTVRIAKQGGIGTDNRTFLFEKEKVPVNGGVLELPYTFTEGGLHEIFFDFAFVSNPEKVYEAPDFLLDIQDREPQLNMNRFVVGLILSSIVGIIFALVLGFWFGKRKV